MPLPPLVRKCGVVHGELIITVKRTRDLAQKGSLQEAHVTLKGNKLCTSELFVKTLKVTMPWIRVGEHNFSPV